MIYMLEIGIEFETCESPTLEKIYLFRVKILQYTFRSDYWKSQDLVK